MLRLRGILVCKSVYIFFLYYLVKTHDARNTQMDKNREKEKKNQQQMSDGKEF